MKKSDSFIFDSNVLISAFLLPVTSTAALAYYKATSQGQIVFSEDTFNEFSNVFLRSKFERYVNFGKRQAIIEGLKDRLNFVPITGQIALCRDPKDNKYLELALSVAAKCIVTGDKDLLVLHPFEGVPILTPADFLANI